MKAPAGACGFSCGDRSYAIEDGHIRIPREHVATAVRHGFEEVAEEVASRASSITSLRRKA